MHTSTIVLGFGYQARHGKDTAVASILAARGNDFDLRVYPFAKALKDEVTSEALKAGGMQQLIEKLRDTEGLPSWVQFDPNPDMSDPLCPLGKQRTLLQWYGTEFRRARDPFYWIKKTDRAIFKDNPQFALISDVRFLNEAYFVKANQGYMVKVTREGYVDAQATNGHASETQLADYQFDIHINVLDGELEQLKKDAVTAFDWVVQDLTPPDLRTEDFTFTEARSA